MNENFIKYAYQNLNRIVSINDSELKFDDVQGYISELELNLENPWEDSITIQNYKTKFEDLFSTIVASSEQMKTNAFAYNNAASAFTSGGTLKPSIIQNTINQTDLTYAFQSGNLTIDEINGIWARSDAGVVAMKGGGIFCATQTDSNGNWLWNTGITPSGINASLLTAGQIDTNLIKIYAGDNLRLQLNQDGLFAYKKNEIGEADLNRYVVHNSDGLFLKVPSEDPKDSSSELINQVEISWNGLIIRDPKKSRTEDPIFYADSEGNLIIEGKITAGSGKIGGWTIGENSLHSSDSNGRTTGMQSGSSDSVYDVFWSKPATGEGTAFRVSSDGSLFANNAIITGTLSAGSIINIGSGSDDLLNVSDLERKITIYPFDGITFYRSSKNLDGNIEVSHTSLLFQIIKTNLPSNGTISLTGNGNDMTTTDDFLWDDESLTFRINYDTIKEGGTEFEVEVSYLYDTKDSEGNNQPKTISNNLLITIVDDPTYNKRFELSDYAYTFVRKEDGSYGENKMFSIITKDANLTSDEIAKATWAIDGQDLNNSSSPENNWSMSENNSSITISSAAVPEGGQITVTCTLLGVTRTIYVFKTKNGLNGQDGISPYSVLIKSSNGEIFKNGNINTNLTAYLYQGATLLNEEDINSPNGENYTYQYQWIKRENNKNTNVGNSPKMSISSDDINERAVYSCDISLKK